MDTVVRSYAFNERFTIFGKHLEFDVTKLSDFNRMQLSQVFTYALALETLQHIHDHDNEHGQKLLNEFKANMTRQGERYQHALKKMIRVFADRLRARDRMSLRLASKVADKSLARALEKCDRFVLRQKKYQDDLAISAALTLTAMSQYVPTSVKDTAGIKNFQDSQGAAKQLPQIIECVREMLMLYRENLTVLSSAYLDPQANFEFLGLRKKAPTVFKTSLRFGDTLVLMTADLVSSDDFAQITNEQTPLQRVVIYNAQKNAVTVYDVVSTGVSQDEL